MDKKKFKDTEFGKIIIDKVPEAAQIVGDILPSNGVFGVVKNIISSSTLSPEEKTSLQKQADDYAVSMADIDEKNIESARSREVSLKNTLGAYVQNISAIVIIISFIAIMFNVTYMKEQIVNKELIYTLLGSLGTMVVTIFNYWYGGSSGSDKKTDSLLNIAERK